ncbi:uncharacterized protein LY79DRAFT_261638 [Colletotrichum navitas]|uniref:Secreted protein n=1 Tax=Colletotrichum navitas TaxID=681940 RepID=A0AAD8PW87_9PEZI|nr:uncharacterized protein LY79DRAFT_261638 [Colletotrichum navitas]KAK1585830.1 hypothetical protein LY79DRAFT_261638 [Colletotrichum navitas]
MAYSRLLSLTCSSLGISNCWAAPGPVRRWFQWAVQSALARATEWMSDFGVHLSNTAGLLAIPRLSTTKAGANRLSPCGSVSRPVTQPDVHRDARYHTTLSLILCPQINPTQLSLSTARRGRSRRNTAPNEDDNSTLHCLFTGQSFSHPQSVITAAAAAAAATTASFYS